jgi:tyrosine-specific transport protein
MKKITVFLKALSVFLGTVIGVGIFGLPFVAQKAGFFVVLGYFLFMVLVAILTHLFFGEVALDTKKIYRLPGYVGEYLGQRWKKLSFFITATGLFGALLAYLIIGGQF